MLDTGTNPFHPILHELLRMDDLGLVFVFVVARSKHVVLSHAPGVHLVALASDRVIVVSSRRHLLNALSIERFDRVGDGEVVDADKVGLLRLLLAALRRFTRPSTWRFLLFNLFFWLALIRLAFFRLGFCGTVCTCGWIFLFLSVLGRCGGLSLCLFFCGCGFGGF